MERQIATARAGLLAFRASRKQGCTMRTHNLSSVIALLLFSSAWSPAGEYVWLEGEKPSAINVKPNIGDWGKSQFLSGGQWLQISVDADKVEKDVPADGILMRYDFTIKKESSY